METPKKSVYIETTIPSYATARASKDMMIAGRQYLTQKFWYDERHKYDLFVSQHVVDECGNGDPDAARRRLELIEGIEILKDTDRTTKLAEIYFKMLNIPKRAKTDCFHLAVSVCEKMDYILSWNCDHIGMESYLKVYEYNVNHGLITPRFFTPETLMRHEREVANEQRKVH